MKSLSRKLYLCRKFQLLTTESNSASIKKAFLNSVKPNPASTSTSNSPRKSNADASNINNVYRPPTSFENKTRNSGQDHSEPSIVEDEFYVPNEYNNKKKSTSSYNKVLKDLKEFTPRICVKLFFYFFIYYFFFTIITISNH